MKKFLVSLVIASSALVAAAPAAAQYRDRDDRRYDNRYDDRQYDNRGDRRYDNRRGQDQWNRFGYGDLNLQPRLDRIGHQIWRGLQNGRITRGEARQLDAEKNRIWQLSKRYWSSHGYDPRERADLERRIRQLQQNVRFERRDDNRRYR